MLIDNPTQEIANSVEHIKQAVEVSTDHKWIEDINRACAARGIEYRGAFPKFPCQPCIDWLIDAVLEHAKKGK